MKKIFLYFWEEMRSRKLWWILFFQTTISAPFYYVIYNYSIKLLIDVIIENDAFAISKFYLPMGLYLFSEIYINAVWRLSNFAGMQCFHQTENAVMLKTYAYVQNHSYKYFTETLSGSVISKINGIKTGFNNLMTGIHYQFGGAIVTSIVTIIAITFTSWKLGIFIFSWTLCFVFIMARLARKMEKLSHAESEEQHQIRGMISDCISNISTLFSFASRNREYLNLEKHIDSSLLPKQKAIWKFEIIFQTTGALLYILLLTISICGVVYLRYSGGISIGNINFILSLSWVFMDSTWRATSEFEGFLRKIGDLKASFSIIDAPNEPDAFENSVLKLNSGEIIFENIDFNYGKESVFESLNLQIKSGEKIGLVGLSGAGKSTIVNLLLRYINPVDGKIKIDGQNIYEFSKNSLRENIAVIPQDIILFNRSLAENIKYGNPFASEDEMHEACKKANIHEFILNLENGYETLVGERGIKLSGGQRQRVGIARAILKNAKILILDEATSSLDSESEKFIQESINNLLDENITVIAIAHRLATLKHMDRILVLENGKITEEGRHEELLLNPLSLYKKLWVGQQI